jgi:hypothetical protein
MSSFLHVQARHRGAEQQCELGPVVQCPVPERAARGGHLGRDVAARVAGHVDGGLDLVGQLAEDVAAHVQQQVLVAAEVAVQRGRRHPHVPGDGAQRDRLMALLDQDLPRGLLDLHRRLGADAVASAQRLRHSCASCLCLIARGLAESPL